MTQYRGSLTLSLSLPYNNTDTVMSVWLQRQTVEVIAVLARNWDLSNDTISE